MPHKHRVIALPVMLILVLSMSLAAGTNAATTVTEFDASSAGTMTWGITSGPDGALWFTAQGDSKIGRITTSGALTTYTVSETPVGGTCGIASGPDHALWFTTAGWNRVGRITTSGETTLYAASSALKMGGITSGPDGALWYLESGADQVGRITTSGAVSHFGGVTASSNLWSITSGPDGALWFTEFGSSKIGRITTAGAVTEYALAAGRGPRGITSGPDGALWFTETTGNRIGRITTAGSIREFAAPSGSGPSGITSGTDGALWFTEAAGAKIARITTAGAISEFGGLSASCVPTSVTSAPDGSLWFTEYAGNKVGRLTGVTPTPAPRKANFDTYIVVQNPNKQAAAVTLTYMVQGGGNKQQTVTAAPTSRKTIRVNDSVDFGSSVSTRVTSNIPVVSERPMYFNYRGVWTGGHDVVGASAPDPAFYFAEGTCRPNFDPYICIQNPGGTDAAISITYMKGDGTTDSQTTTVAADSRSTIRVRDRLGEGDDASHDFSAKVACTNGQKIIAERPMYFNYAGVWTGGHDVIGATSAARDWFFAEGTCRANFDPYICIQNPGGADARVTITYMKGDGTTASEGLTVNKHSRSTVKVKDRLGEGDDASHDFSAQVSCTNGQTIIAERPMYFNYAGLWTGGHDVIGATAASSEFYFAEGTCRPDFEPYFCIQNPGAADANVTITYMKGDGSTDTQALTVVKHSRYTVKVKDKLGEANDAAHDFSAKVSCTNGQKIIAERPMYFNYQGYTQLNWTGGHDVIGAATPAKTWYFAEGYTGI
jgi:virginiamycin B lyase